MADIQNVAEVERVVGRWNASDLAFIEEFHVGPSGDYSSWDMVVTFLAVRRDTAKGGWPGDNKPRFRVVIKFFAIVDLKLSSFSGPITQVMGFDLIDIRDRRWEDKTFLVEDYENGCISFLCKSVEILSVGLVSADSESNELQATVRESVWNPS